MNLPVLGGLHPISQSAPTLDGVPLKSVRRITITAEVGMVTIATVEMFAEPPKEVVAHVVVIRRPSWWWALDGMARGWWRLVRRALKGEGDRPPRPER